MSELIKPFEKTLFNQYDAIAKETITKYLSKKYDVTENPDPYGPDLYVKNTCFAETEIKEIWTGFDFPFATVNIPARKEKYLKAGRVLFFVLSKNLKRAIVFEGKDLKKEYLKEVPNKFISQGELFFQIPVTLCKVIDLE